MKHTPQEVQEFRNELDAKKDEAFARLLADVRAGGTETLKQWCAFMGHFHAYSWGNILLAYSQKPDLTQLASYDTWKKVGRQVRQGEKGIKVFVPTPIKRTVTVTADDGSERDEVRPVMRFKIGTVFDLSQTDGPPLPEHPLKASGDTTVLLPALEAAMQTAGLRVSTVLSIAGHASALGVSRGQGLIEVRSDLDTAMRCSVLVHEWAHDRLHWRGEKAGKQVREADAELVAYMVTDHFGLHTAAADYLVQWEIGDTLLAERLPLVWDTARDIIKAVYESAGTDTPAETEAVAQAA